MELLTRWQRLVRWTAQRCDLLVLPYPVVESWAEKVTNELKSAQTLDNLGRGADARNYDNRAAVRMEMLKTIKDCNSPREG